MQMINVLGKRNPPAVPSVSASEDESEDFPDTESNMDEGGEADVDGPKPLKLKTKLTVRVQTMDDGKGNASKGNKKMSGLAVERMTAESLVRQYLKPSHPDSVLDVVLDVNTVRLCRAELLATRFPAARTYVCSSLACTALPYAALLYCTVIHCSAALL
jgi:hypothetical protein